MRQRSTRHVVPRHRKGTPPRARIKGLISPYEFLVSVGSQSAPMGTLPCARFINLSECQDQFGGGPISVLNHNDGRYLGRKTRPRISSCKTATTARTSVPMAQSNRPCLPSRSLGFG